jgi:hypothetical protein
MNKIGSVLIALTLTVSQLGSTSSIAAGAFAIGSSGDVARDGVAIGHSVNQSTKAAAAALALQQCRNYNPAPKMAKLCKVIETFTRQCFALAFDPKPGTPGVGWAIGPDKKSAETLALTACQATAGADRRGFCMVMTTPSAASTAAANSATGTVCDTHD